jgi:hypothetical protein
MELFKTKLRYLDKELVFISFLIIVFLLIVFNFSQTIDFAAKLIGVENFNFFGDTSNQPVDAESPSNVFNFVSPQLATFILWGIVGFITFIFINFVYTLFIHPLINDIVESTYVNSRKKLLLEKRILWVLLVILSIVLLVLSVSLFIFVALPYYTIMLNEQNIESLLVVVCVALMCSLCVSLLKSTAEAIVKTY